MKPLSLKIPMFFKETATDLGSIWVALWFWSRPSTSFGGQVSSKFPNGKSNSKGKSQVFFRAKKSFRRDDLCSYLFRVLRLRFVKLGLFCKGGSQAFFAKGAYFFATQTEKSKKNVSQCSEKVNEMVIIITRLWFQPI